MPKIDIIRLRAIDPDAQVKFYTDILGMRKRHDGAVSYAGCEAGLLFEKADAAYQASDANVYWKFSLAVPNRRSPSCRFPRSGLSCIFMPSRKTDRPVTISMLWKIARGFVVS